MSYISETTFETYLGHSELATLAERESLYREVERDKGWLGKLGPISKTTQKIWQ